MRRLLAWILRHKKLSLLILLLALFTALNISAYLHAHAMTHIAGPGYRTPKPADLTFLQKVVTLFSGVRIPKTRNWQTPAILGLPFTTRRIRSEEGLTLEAWHVAAPGSIGLVLLHHGYANCKASLVKEAGVFHGMGYETLLVDSRACGGSDGLITTVGYDEARDVAAAFRYAKGLGVRGPIILFGQSMGAAAVLRAIAEEGVAPDAAILECPFNSLLATVKHRFEIMGLPSFPAAHLLVFWGGAQHGFNGFAHAPEQYAKKVRCPALLLVGAEDRQSTALEVRSIFENLAGPGQIEVFEGGGHGDQLSVHPEAWKQAVKAFLRTKLPAGGRVGSR